MAWKALVATAMAAGAAVLVVAMQERRRMRRYDHRRANNF